MNSRSGESRDSQLMGNLWIDFVIKEFLPVMNRCRHLINRLRQCAAEERREQCPILLQKQRELQSLASAPFLPGTDTSNYLKATVPFPNLFQDVRVYTSRESSSQNRCTEFDKYDITLHKSTVTMDNPPCGSMSFPRKPTILWRFPGLSSLAPE